MLGLVPLALVKMSIGIARDRPVGILLTAMVVVVLIALCGFARRVHRSRLGDAAPTAFLEMLKEGETKVRARAPKPPPAPVPRVEEKAEEPATPPAETPPAEKPPEA